MIRRRRPLLRAAAVGGGAYLAGKHVANKQADAQAAEDEQNARLDNMEQQQQGGYGSYPPQGAPPPPGYGYPPQGAPPPPGYGYPPQAAPPPAAEPAAGPSMMDQLTQLADLHKQGILSDDEFTAAKAKLLG